MNKTTLSEKIKQLGLRLFEDKTASELEYIIKEIFPNAKILTDFLSYKDNLGKITFKVNEDYKDEFGKTELWTEVKTIEEYLRIYDLYIDIEKNIENKVILKAYVSIDYLDNENELKYFNSNIETIYAVNEGNRILNYYIDAVTTQRQENEDYIEQYKDYSTQTIDEAELKLKAKALGKLLLDTQNLKHPNYRDIQNSIMSIFPSAKYKGCVDIYNPKVIRSTMGSIFDMNIIQTTQDEAVDFFKANNFDIVSSYLHTESYYNETTYDGKIALVIGNEANGINDELISKSDKLVKIPIYGNAESLNAALSAAILMYEIKKYLV